jgi:hypothetical protein
MEWRGTAPIVSELGAKHPDAKRFLLVEIQLLRYIAFTNLSKLQICKPLLWFHLSVILMFHFKPNNRVSKFILPQKFNGFRICYLLVI